MATVAVIGGGAAGIGAARLLLAEGHDVVLVEAAPRLGGNCLGIDVAGEGSGIFTVDAGVSDFNRTTFRELARLIDDLGLPTRPIGTDTSFATLEGRTVASCRGGRWTIDVALPGVETLPEEIDRFRLRAVEVLEDGRFETWTVARYLDHVGASRALRDLYVYPRAIGCFPMPDCSPRHYSIHGLIAFWRIHGVVGREPANRHCVVGGMHRYVSAFARWFTGQGGELLCGTRVLGLARRRWGVEVRTVDRDDRHRRLEVGHVVLACSPRDALPLLDAPSVEEIAALGGCSHQRARVVVHGDERLAGHDRGRRGAFHYFLPEGALPRVKPTITFVPGRLAGLPEGAPDVFVTMNPHVEPRPESIVAERYFAHPIAGPANAAAASRIEALQGRRRTWYAGSALVSPFVHESALVSGMHAARLCLGSEKRRTGTPRIALAAAAG